MHFLHFCRTTHVRPGGNANHQVTFDTRWLLFRQVLVTSGRQTSIIVLLHSITVFVSLSAAVVAFKKDKDNFHTRA